MFIDRLLDTILRPFRELWGYFSRVRGIQTGIVSDVHRVRNVGDYARSEVGQIKNMVVAPGQLLPGYGQAQQAAQMPHMAQQQAEKKKMGWSFPWSKKTCPRCQNKLQKSWDQCPYCGQNQNQPVTAGPPAAGGAPGVDLTKAIVPVIERQAAGALQVAITTRRRGLVKKLVKQGYVVSGVTLRKRLQ